MCIRDRALGVDVEKVMEQLQKVAISMHCWQADDVIGFESGGSLTGGDRKSTRLNSSHLKLSRMPS